METCSSGEDLIVKTRKPYTITKQRERWTEEEHNRFLEALKLYGRAWQRIEEHIGTKKAVQIRSHAQKFFSKLEKEALTKGVPLGQAHDIDIPPPRPKRKPSNPYPRKTGVAVPPISPSVGSKDGKTGTSVASLYPSKQVLDLENDPPTEETPGNGTFGRTKETSDEGNCSEVLDPFQEAPCPSISSVSRNSLPRPVALTNPCVFREFVPSTKKPGRQTSTDESSLTVEFKGNPKVVKGDTGYKDPDIGRTEGQNLQNYSQGSNDKIALIEGTNDMKQIENANEMPAAHNYPRHIPVHVVDGKTMKCMQNPSSKMTDQIPVSHESEAYPNPNHIKSPTVSAISEHHMNTEKSSMHQTFPINHPPFTPFRPSPDAYRSCNCISSTCISTSQHNRAAHAAASLAASFWQCANYSLADTPVGGFPMKNIDPSPSLAAIAATTVAAASAWWASQGLLPFCPPLHIGFVFSPLPTTTIPTTKTIRVPEDTKERVEKTPQNPPQEDHQVPDSEFSEALKSRHSLKKSSSPFPSDSEESGDAKSCGDEQKVACNAQMPESSIEFHGSKNGMMKKQLDRSSCGSNTASGSEIEQDLVLEKHTEGMEEHKEAELSHLAGDPINRRCRSTGNINDPWKEVSEEGRLAFQALFSRDVLPQSFSPPHDLRNKVHPKNDIEEGKQNSSKNNEEDALDLELSSKTWAINLDHPAYSEKDELSSNNIDKLPTTGLVEHGKLKAHRTGFKPYKRCCVEAKESRGLNNGSQTEEKCAKRLRLEGEASA